MSVLYLLCSPDSCDGSLASILPATSFQSSSHFSDSQAAYFGKLNKKDGKFKFSFAC